LERETAERDKEKEDEKKAEGQDHDRYCELALADVDKPQLKRLDKDPNSLAAKKAAKADGAERSEDELASNDDEEAGNVQADAIKRETVNILSDLIEQTKVPRSAAR
jgi:hypothetical protein